MTKMNEDVKQKWVAALRSDEYEQGENTLKTEDGKYCCLGVLCDLAVKEGIAVEMTAEERATLQGRKHDPLNEGLIFFGGKRTDGTPMLSSVDVSAGVLPWAVSDWAGLSTSNPMVYGVLPGQEEDGETHTTLSMFNDRGQPFSYIADLIEENL